MSVGHVHGRFQPFHKEHAKYVQWANDQCDELIIGITNADPSHTTKEESDSKRHRNEHNPYSYFERQRMISAFVDSEQFDGTAFITPFPVNRPSLWKHYVSESVTHYVNVVERWDREKVDRIRNDGREVITKQKEREISGTAVREKMRNGETWETDVPVPVVETIRSFDLELPK